ISRLSPCRPDGSCLTGRQANPGCIPDRRASFPVIVGRFSRGLGVFPVIPGRFGGDDGSVPHDEDLTEAAEAGISASPPAGARLGAWGILAVTEACVAVAGWA